MARFARASRSGDSCRGRCDIHRHDRHHHCFHRLTGSLAGSTNVYINGLAAQKVGDRVTFNSCQHGGSGVIIDGSDSVFVNGRPAARIKDGVRCQNGLCMQEMVIIEGSSNVFFG